MMSQYQYNDYKCPETILRDLETICRKMHKTSMHIEFLSTCRENDCLPNFTKIAASTIRNLNLKTPQILSHRYKHFDDTLNSHYFNLDQYKQILNNLFRQISFYNPYNASKIISICKSRVTLEEQLNDIIRNKKLNNLIIENSPKYKPPIVTIYNHTDIELPTEIRELLEQGLHNPIGGYNTRNFVLTKFEDLFKSWKIHAERKKLDVFQINHVKSKLYLAFEQFKNCTTDSSANKLRDYLDSNPHIIIAGSDKTKNLNILFFDDYLRQLDKVFDKEHF